VDVALGLEGPHLSERYVRAYLSLNPSDLHVAAIRAAGKLMEPGPDQRNVLQGILDTLPAPVLGQVMIIFWRYPDSAETAVRIFRRYANDTRDSRFSTREFRSWAAGVVAYRGHLREAISEFGTGGSGSVTVAAALLGLIPRESARAVFSGWLAQRRGNAPYALPWWSAAADTTSLQRFIRWHEEPASSQPHLSSQRQYWVAAGRGFLALARGDTMAALREFTQVPDSSCTERSCLGSLLKKVELLTGRGMDREAAATLRRDPGWAVSPLSSLRCSGCFSGPGWPSG
jgi:hypothetical protein